MFIHASVIAADLQPAISSFNDSHYAQAKALLTSVVDDSALKNDALYYLARIAFEEGDLDKAKNLLHESLKIEPNSSDEYYWLGRIYGELAIKANLLKQAAYAKSAHQYFELAVKADPKNVAAQRGLFMFYLLAPAIMGGSLDTAEKILSDIRALSPEDADIKLLDLLDEREEQVKRLAQAKYVEQKYPNSAEALFNSAEVYSEQQLFVEAINAYVAAANINITHNNRTFVESALFRLGELCVQTHMRVDDGIRGLEKLLILQKEEKKFNENWIVWNLAKLYREKNNVNKYQILRQQLDLAYVKTDKKLQAELDAFKH